MVVRLTVNTISNFCPVIASVPETGHRFPLVAESESETIAAVASYESSFLLNYFQVFSSHTFFWLNFGRGGHCVME
jgi:hypothetical protein